MSKKWRFGLAVAWHRRAVYIDFGPWCLDIERGIGWRFNDKDTGKYGDRRDSVSQGWLGG